MIKKIDVNNINIRKHKMLDQEGKKKVKGQRTFHPDKHLEDIDHEF